MIGKRYKNQVYLMPSSQTSLLVCVTEQRKSQGQLRDFYIHLGLNLNDL